MLLVSEKFELNELKKIAEDTFGDFVKGVVDIDQEIMVIDAELHADEEQYLLNMGSEQKNLWGINIYPFNNIDELVEFDSMINIRPRQNNRSRSVEDPEIREKIIKIVNKLIMV